MNRPSNSLLAIIAGIAILFICCICSVVGIGAISYFRVVDAQQGSPPFSIAETPPASPQVIRPTYIPTQPPTGLPPSTQIPGVSEANATPQIPAKPNQAPANFPVPTDTLKTLESSTVPVNDLIDLAQRLEGKFNISPTLEPPAAPFQDGAQQSFWVMNTAQNKNFKIQATLQYVTPHVYFWVEDGVSYNKNALKKLAETFETKIYPTDREFFGSEWTPGVDGDPHLYILYAKGLGGSVAGYFSSGDEYPPQASEYSNGHEMFLLSADLTNLDEEFTYGTLAHEFQHMIHWYGDRNEELWMNEGFSELAAFLNGYDIGGHDLAYAADPDIQLNDWPTEDSLRIPHYGASFLFLTYFLDRFGRDITKAVVADPANGMTSIDHVLSQQGVTDPVTGKQITADDVFADWVVASYLQNKEVGDGRFTYHNYPQAPKPSDTETISRCPADQTSDVSQYGVDYIKINCRGNFTLHFEGSVENGVLPVNPHSGNYAFWSNKGDESDMTLTRTFDFGNVSGPLTFKYWTWYDLEKDYDYVYLVASQDEGKTWQILKTPSGTGADPSGNSYGWGYNGMSGGGDQAQWIQESVDLSQFAGKKMQLRFEYVTDPGVNGEGFLVDDVTVPEINYTSDFEHDDGGWESAGFVRIENVLPQTYRLALIDHGRSTNVQEFSLSGENAIDIPLNLSGDVRSAVLVVSGTTPFTRQKAPYHFTIK